MTNTQQAKLNAIPNLPFGHYSKDYNLLTAKRRWHTIRVLEASKTVFRYMKKELDDDLKAIYATGCAIQIRGNLIKVQLKLADFDQSLGPVYLAVHNLLNKHMPLRKRVMFLIVSAIDAKATVLFKFWPNVLH